MQRNAMQSGSGQQRRTSSCKSKQPGRDVIRKNAFALVENTLLVSKV